jgi:hypothetical protein
MKSKNLILALVAIVFAVGSAFTSKDLLSPVFVHWKQTQQGSFLCTSVPLTCTNAIENTATCTVSIQKADLSFESVTAYINDDCQTAAKHSSATAVGPYDAGDGNRPYDVQN